MHVTFEALVSKKISEKFNIKNIDFKNSPFKKVDIRHLSTDPIKTVNKIMKNEQKDNVTLDIYFDKYFCMATIKEIFVINSIESLIQGNKNSNQFLSDLKDICDFDAVICKKITKENMKNMLLWI